jgi:hypothetical protein
MFFAHPIGMKWYKPLTVPLKDTIVVGMTKSKPWTYRERAKIHNALGKFTNDWTKYGVSIIFDGWTNVKGMPLISILSVFASVVVFLSS